MSAIGDSAYYGVVFFKLKTVPLEMACRLQWIFNISAPTAHNRDFPWKGEGDVRPLSHTQHGLMGVKISHFC